MRGSGGIPGDRAVPGSAASGVAEHTGSDRKTFDGKLCLFVQHASVEWRDLEFGLYVWQESWRLERKKRLSDRFTRADRHTYRIEVEGRRIRCLVDDREIADVSSADRELTGPAGFWLQDVSVEIRRFTLEAK